MKQMLLLGIYAILGVTGVSCMPAHGQQQPSTSPPVVAHEQVIVTLGYLHLIDELTKNPNKLEDTAYKKQIETILGKEIEQYDASLMRYYPAYTPSGTIPEQVAQRIKQAIEEAKVRRHLQDPKYIASKKAKAEYDEITMPPRELPLDYAQIWHEKLGPFFPPPPQIDGDGMEFSEFAMFGRDESLEQDGNKLPIKSPPELAKRMRTEPEKTRTLIHSGLVSFDQYINALIQSGKVNKLALAMNNILAGCKLAGNMPDIEQEVRIRLGRMYVGTGDEDAALAVFAPIMKQNPDFAPGLAVRAEMNRTLGKHSAALSDYRHILALLPNNAINASERSLMLLGLSRSLAATGDKAGALQFIHQAQEEAQQWNAIVPAQEAQVALGDLEVACEQYFDAEKTYTQVLSHIASVSEADLVNLSFLGLMHCAAAHDRPSEAVFFGKMALKAYNGARSASPRSKLPTYDPFPATVQNADALQEHWADARHLHFLLRTREADFRFLVDTLMEQGRTAEAVAVLDFFKEEESLDSHSEATRSFPRLEVELRPFWDTLSALYARYFQKSPALSIPDREKTKQQIKEEKTRLVAFLQPQVEMYAQNSAHQFADLANNTDVSGGSGSDFSLSFTPHEREDLAKIGPMISIKFLPDHAKLLRMMNGFVDMLPDGENKKTAKAKMDEVVRSNTPEYWEELFQSLHQRYSSVPDSPVATVSTRHLQTTLHELGHRSAAVYTLLNDRHLHLILVTPSGIYAHTIDIEKAEVEKYRKQFLQNLRNPNLDPRPAGKQLYDLLVAPLEKELQQENIETIMWSLDGNLRYIPMAALWDGTQYMLQRYAVSLFTPASHNRLTRLAEPVWTVLGLGTSQAHGDFPALRGVRAELNSIVRTESNGGVLQGKVLLDNQFTLEGMLTALKNGYQVLHIASHFALTPGDPVHSGLLLGDGSLLTLPDIAMLPDSLFAGVHLLTLSACQTAADENGNGRELENFALIAQRKGAEAIIGSLWALDDNSASLVMPTFYRLRENKMTKTEALREAQLALLTGKYRETEEQKARRNERSRLVSKSPSPLVPAFKYDPNAPYAHPFYWAPLVLIGNWL